MRGYLLLLCGSLLAGISHAQSERQAIQQWQSRHPNTQLISEQRYASLSDEERSLLGKDILLYKDKITLTKLEEYDLAEKANQSSQLEIKQEDKVILKNWLAENSDVKLIPRSYYNSLEDSRKVFYDQNSRCLILEGESLTLKDIEQFEQ